MQLKNRFLGVLKLNYVLGLLFNFFCVSLIFQSEKSSKFAFFRDVLSDEFICVSNSSFLPRGI